MADKSKSNKSATSKKSTGAAKPAPPKKTAPAAPAAAPAAPKEATDSQKKKPPAQVVPQKAAAPAAGETKDAPKKPADNTKSGKGAAKGRGSTKEPGPGPGGLSINAKEVAKEAAKEAADLGDPDAKLYTEQTAETTLLPEGDLHSSTGKYDCHAFFILCPAHEKVLVTKRANVRWMPFIEMPPKRSWEDGALVGFCLVLAASDKARFEELKKAPPFRSYKCMHLLRIQVPQTLKFIKRTTYFFTLNPEAENFSKCCSTEIAAHLEWLPLADVKAGKVTGLWGPELVECSKHIGDTAVKEKIAEYSLEEMYKYVPRDPPRNTEEELLKSLSLTQTDVERLYADFIAHCYPSFYLSPASFAAYLAAHGLVKEEAKAAKLFTAFNAARNGYLSFHELLLGLAAMEPAAKQGEHRAKLIFRYYDADGAGKLNEEKVKALVADLGDGGAELGKTVGNEASEKDFAAAVGKSEAAGKLCRLPKPIFAEISRALAMQHLKRYDTAKKSGSVAAALANVLPKRAHKGVCPTCVEKKFELAAHLVTVDLSGKVTPKRLAAVKPPAKGKGEGGPTAGQYSAEVVFRPYSVGNVMLRLIRQLAKAKGTVAEPKALLMGDRKEDFWKLILRLYRDLLILLEAETKCQKAYSPCYVIGDIHGNIEDLLQMERTLWPLAPVMGAGCLFLGDYVDRGVWSLECTLYIAALKLLAPNRITMLRGNHEERTTQKHYSYLKECVQKYGEEMGLKVWELTNRIYDQLPVCGLVDDAIYCAHGGLPKSAKTVEQIVEVKRDIRNPEKESDIAWEILWSDPANEQEFVDTCEQKGVDPKTSGGFVFNTKRGTAFKFNEAGADSFLKANGLTHIIRAHEVAPPGYVFHFINKCVTIFSTSHYCGNNNLCGFILADNQRLRVIHLDTAANGSATD